MKFTLTIQDLDAEGVQSVLDTLGGVEVESGGEPAGAGSLDASGLPWDARIHSSNRKITDKGFWQKKRGVSELKFSEVEAELRAATPVAAPIAQAPTAPVVQQVAPQPSAPSVPVATVVPQTAPIAAQAAPLAAPQAPAAAPAPQPSAPVFSRDFNGLMGRIAQLFGTGQIDATYPPTIVQRINHDFKSNIVAPTDIAGSPQMVEYAWACLEIDGLA